MDNILTIHLKNKVECELELAKGEAVLDTLAFPLDIHFDTMLVTSIDKILKKNRIETSSLKKVNIAGFVAESSVAYHIASSVKAALECR
ncbi:hypothetical protein KW791_02315 [Candidatus Parcubacteria bacterium]|nr:hypothetical protein [Candidatus Parcubacteria bacterium]